MIELADIDRFPVTVVMALKAIRAQPALVLILVAGRAGGGKSEECPVEILDLNEAFLRGRNVIRCVAAVARKPGMFSFQCISCLLVVEAFRVPLDQWEVLSIVFRVATCALLTRTGHNVIRRMKALPSSDAGCNFSVTIEALELSLSANFVAGRAIGRSAQGLVGSRQRSRRYLRLS